MDDIWPTEESRTGFLDDLCQLSRSSLRSRIVITTRSMAISRKAGESVSFGARDPLGAEAVRIFKAYAGFDFEGLPPSISKILSVCGGLP